MSEKPFTWKRGGQFDPDTVYLNGVELSADDICDLLNHLPVTADGVPLCRCPMLYCPACGCAMFYCIGGVDDVCGGCDGVYPPTDRLSKPKGEVHEH